MSDLVSLARSLAEELVGQREFGTELGEAAQVCLEYLAEAVDAERSSASGWPSPRRGYISPAWRVREHRGDSVSQCNYSELFRD